MEGEREQGHSLEETDQLTRSTKKMKQIVINLKFDPFSTPILPLFSYNLSTNLSKKAVEYTFLTYYALICPISWSAGLKSRKWEFPAGFAKKWHSGINFWHEWSADEAREHHLEAQGWLQLRTVCCRPRTAVPRRQKLRTTVRHDRACQACISWSARLPVRMWHDRACLIFSRLNLFRQAVLGEVFGLFFLLFFSLKRGGDFWGF